MTKTVGAIISILVLFGIFFGAYKYIDDRYALAEEHKKLELRLDYKIKDDQRISIQQEMRQIEEKNLGKLIEKWDSRDRNRYKDLLDQLKNTQEKLKSLQ